MTEQVLQVENFTMRYKTRKGDVSAVEDVSFTLERGEALGLGGESGWGKTSLAVALLRLLLLFFMIGISSIYLVLL